MKNKKKPTNNLGGRWTSAPPLPHTALLDTPDMTENGRATFRGCSRCSHRRRPPVVTRTEGVAKTEG